MPKSAYIFALVLAASTVSLAGPSSAHAQRATDLDEPYIAAKLTLGFGGSVTSTYEGRLGRVETDRDLQVSFGLAGQYIYPLHQYFAVGGLFGFQTWRSTGNGDAGRNLVFDLAVLPQGKYELIANVLELNVTIPIGLALDMLNEVDARNQLVLPAIGAAAGGSFEGNTALGFVFGFLVGARYQLVEDVGLLAEVGYLYRTVGHTITATAGGAGVTFETDADVSLGWGQFALNLGAYF
jgi:hypothetical protein